MVSIENAKRYMLDPTPELAVKKSRFTSHYEAPHVVSLNSSYHSENLSRLRVLFPFKQIDELSKVLEAASGSYDYAVLLIQQQEQDKIAKAIIDKSAQDMIFELTSAQNVEHAVKIAINYLDKPKNEGKDQVLLNENRVLCAHASTLTKENQLLKKAVIKLHESSSEVLGKDQEIEKLSKELENERIKTYHLSMQLSLAINRHRISPSRELF